MSLSLSFHRCHTAILGYVGSFSPTCFFGGPIRFHTFPTLCLANNLVHPFLHLHVSKMRIFQTVPLVQIVIFILSSRDGDAFRLELSVARFTHHEHRLVPSPSSSMSFFPNNKDNNNNKRRRHLFLSPSDYFGDPATIATSSSMMTIGEESSSPSSSSSTSNDNNVSPNPSVTTTTTTTTTTIDTNPGPIRGKVHRLMSLKEFFSCIDTAPMNSLVVIKFFGRSCPLCRKIQMRYKKMAYYYGSVAPIQFVEIEQRIYPQLCKVLGIDTYPHIQIYRNGQCVASHGTESDTAFEPIVKDTIERELLMTTDDWDAFLTAFAIPIGQMTMKLNQLRQQQEIKDS